VAQAEAAILFPSVWNALSKWDYVITAEKTRLFLLWKNIELIKSFGTQAHTCFCLFFFGNVTIYYYYYYYY